MDNKKAAVFILLGQSNAVGHGVPMEEADKITAPMKNVFGLHREKNQSYDITKLFWQGYTSDGMNLGEEQDHTYSVANCLAAQWQAHIDSGNAANLPDLYIVQIAIGAQGVTEKYMWYPDRPQQLIPGKLGTAKISLFSFTKHIFSLLDESFREMGKDYDVIGLHWRGGENDATIPSELLESTVTGIYERILDAFMDMLGQVPVVVHWLACPDRMNKLDPSGQFLQNMHYINSVFEHLEQKYPNVTLFDVRNAPDFVSDVPGNGLFIKDMVHFTPSVNNWVAGEILKGYIEK